MKRISKTAEKNWRHHFPIISQWKNFRRSSAVNSVVGIWIRPAFEHIHYVITPMQYSAILTVNVIFFLFFLKTKIAGTRSLFRAKNKKNNVYPSKPQFYFIKLGCKCV